MQIIKNRRYGTRVPARGEALVQAGSHRMRCRCVDLSPGGAGILAPYPVSAGSPVELSLELEGARHELRARVARVRRNEQGWVWGLHFDGSQPLGPAVSRGQQRLVWMRQVMPYLSRLGGRDPKTLAAGVALDVKVPESMDGLRSDRAHPAAPAPSTDYSHIPVRTGLTEPQTVIPPLTAGPNQQRVGRRPLPTVSVTPPPAPTESRRNRRTAPKPERRRSGLQPVSVEDLDLDDAPTCIYEEPPHARVPRPIERDDSAIHRAELQELYAQALAQLDV